MAVKLECQLEFGADTVCTRHQDRIPVFFADFKKGAETTNASQYTIPHRAFGKGFDGIDQRITGINIDTGIAVRKGLFG